MLRMSLLALLSGNIFLATSQAGLAADMRNRAPIYKTAAVEDNWTGFYIGGHAGYGWGAKNMDGLETGPAPIIELLPYSNEISPKGALGGATLGYNWQKGFWVTGIEADISLANIRGSGVQASLFSPLGALTGQQAEASQTMNWFGTVRGRLGFTPSAGTLVYATGGLAVGDMNYSSEWYVSNTIQYPSAENKTKFGWVLGVGAEWLVVGNWSLKTEYLHYDLGKHTVSFSDATFAANGASLEATFKNHDDIVRMGINYRLD
jgi:outer membrane immunogenic protein